ncbi:putative short-chain dehydrogenase/reductase [Aphanomyces cochlioides]|nr:putative short-chain dehydrogenase/reductase [Aphanomyces cochlioides]
MAPQAYLVTGANKDIGYEVVRILSERLSDQAIILLGTRSLDNGKAAIAKMQQANRSFNYANVYSLEIDVTKSESIQAAAEFVKATYGTLHALINNAGITAYVEGVAKRASTRETDSAHELAPTAHSDWLNSGQLRLPTGSSLRLPTVDSQPSSRRFEWKKLISTSQRNACQWRRADQTEGSAGQPVMVCHGDL